jgi:hypothetical protein
MPGGCRQLTAVKSTVEIDVCLAPPVGEFHVFSRAAGLWLLDLSEHIP